MRRSDIMAEVSLRRKVVNKLMTLLVLVAVVLAIVPLILILGDVFIKGAPAMSLTFLTHKPTAPNLPGGGIAPAIQGSFIMVGLAALISVPIGVGAGIFFSEWSTSRLSTISGFMNDVLTGFPTMVIGLFVFILIVLTMKTYSALAGGVALSIIMTPIIARTTSESLKLVPTTLREASMALGIPRWKTVIRIVLSTGKNGLLTGILLAVARASGETAPLLFTAGAGTLFVKNLTSETGSITVLIYNYALSSVPSWISQAWGAALLLLLLMLALNLLVKLTIGRNLTEARMET
jgi:phosphate transport system permease protein